MHYSQIISALCLSTVPGLVSGAAIVQPASVGKRSIQLGWSLQASTCPAGSNSCGSGACCPSSLFCIANANDEVDACCTTNSPCRGSIEGHPVCADSSWSLWKGFQGNGFCCQVGLNGVYNSGGTVAGTCVSGAAPAGYTAGSIVTTGSGSTVTSPPTSSQSTKTTATPTTSAKGTATSSTGAGSTGKPVFFHYMIGTITDAHCEQDIKDAIALGADAFALNLNTDTASWATTTVTSLFNWAETLGFKLFFSFDMTGFNNPSQFTSYLQSYVTSSAYYHYNNLPLVSTFNGGAGSYTFGQDTVNDGWKVELEQVMANAGHPIYFVPAFQDVTITSSFFTTYPSLNGAMNWNSWPQNTQGDIIVPTTDDQTLLTAAHAAGKTFLMGVSPLQFKHLDSSDNWYRRGEQNLEYRFGQVLSMQPDFIELQTWNDAGESHYMGNSWPEPIAGTAIVGYTENYDHTGYWQLLPAFIKAYKAGATTTSTMYPTNGAAAQGTFWHHTLLAAGTCPSDSLGPPQGVSTVENRVTAGILVAAGQTGLKAVVTSGSTTLGTQTLTPGFNGFSFLGMTTGVVSVKVVNSAGTTVISGSGPIAVVSTASLCNYNFQVVGLA